MSEDEEVQRRGIVYVHFQVGPQLGASPHKKVLWKGLTMSRKISTTKCTAIHLCFDRSKMSVVGLFRLASAQLTNRIRVHEGKWRLKGRHDSGKLLVFSILLGPNLRLTNHTSLYRIRQ